MEQTPWYSIADITQLDTPALVIYPERVKQNIASLVRSIDSVDRLRPHVKTSKSREASQLLIDAGIRKFKCATIAEAEMLASIGAPDVLLAYQPNEAKMHRLLSLKKAYPETVFSCLVDNVTTARQLSELAVGAGIVMPVYIDLNVGMNRTGMVPGEAVLTLYTELSSLPGIRPMGLHAYDGHLRDPNLAVRTTQCDTAFWPVKLLSDTIAARGLGKPILVVGGSPTFPIHAKRPDVECSPGTFIYWDKGYQSTLAEQPFLPASLVVTRVISLPDTTKVCLDVGHKSIAAEGELNQRITFLNAPELKAIGQSEEHLVVEAGEGHSYKVGDVLYGLPHHICPTVALYERAYTVENGTLSGEWRTVSRDRVISI
ncbi:D-TA family PLP-dependent enzyme [Spirosoma sp.]|uniref:D-TA family PLP-dependent enzyme n=1 Tax=Spirosoma sp. TaxID=1899569 RepID=UPI0026200B23|nr:D-TA family PLP-dependent enzyme [Spirosoma sp.]MCX6215019.1 D-TA family PLP-dependent enzyme [Spirosoma sp.]